MDRLVKKIRTIGFFFTFLSMLFCTGFFYACTVSEQSLADEKNYTQEDDQYKRKYEISLAEGEKPLRYWYHYVVSSLPGGYKVKVFHPDRKTLIEERSYSTPALTLLHGPYKNYWDDGSIRRQGIYQFGRKHGSWLECEADDGKSATGPYANDKKEGAWTQLDTNGLIESVYTWRDGVRHGKFYEYDTTGHKINEGIYSADTLVSELLKRPQIQKPFLKGCQGYYGLNVYACTESSLIKQVYNQLKYPTEARQMGIEGAVLVQWEVMPDGSVQNLRVPQALSDEIENECLRVLNYMSEWVPAHKDGIPIKWPMSLPINFKL